MKAQLTDDLQKIMLFYDDNFEYQTIKQHFYRVAESSKFVKYQTKQMSQSFLYNEDTLNSTMLYELRNICNKSRIELHIDDSKLYRNISRSYVLAFTNKLLQHTGMKLREYQVDAVWNLVNNRNCCVEVATGGGKTLIIYCYIAMMSSMDFSDRCLIITPDPSLAIQNMEKFMEYSGGMFDIKIGLTKNDPEKFPKHMMGSFSKLALYGDGDLACFDTVIVDEAHRSKAHSYEKIVNNVGQTLNRIGLSGSYYDDESLDAFKTKNLLGSIVYRITKSQLVDIGSITPTTVYMTEIDFAPHEDKKKLAIEKEYSSNIARLELEREYVRSSQKLIDYKTQYILGLDGNTIAYFFDKQNSYGKRIYSQLVMLNKVRNLGKYIFYIDGDVNKNEREKIKHFMSITPDNCILVASYTTFSTGQSIDNLIHEVFCEGFKSDVLNNQSTGRLTRLHVGKEMSYVHDFIENTNIALVDAVTLKKKHHRCYMSKWGSERKKYYESEKFRVLFNKMII